MKKEPILVIMAAGMGSRFGGLKQITPVSGDEIILDFSLFDAIKAGFKRAIIVIKEENREAFEHLVSERAGKHIGIDYAYQRMDDIPDGFSIPEGRTKPWGTGQAAISGRSVIDAPFAVINSDDYYGPEAFKILYGFLSGENRPASANGKYQFCMVGFPVENTLTDNGTVSRGVSSVKDGLLTGVTERSDIKWADPKKDKVVFSEDGETWQEIPLGTPVSMNVWGFSEEFVTEAWNRFSAFLEKVPEAPNPLKAEYPLPGIVDALIKENLADVTVISTPDRWYGVTYAADKETVTNALSDMKARGIYPEKLW